jgi:hypothetical protein
MLKASKIAMSSAMLAMYCFNSDKTDSPVENPWERLNGIW